jgi:hypothetical protein
VDQEELTIAGAFEEAKNLKELGTLLREGKMKEFYQLANRVLMIKRNHPVVTKVRCDNQSGEPEVFEERNMVERAIAGYFTEVYKRPDHLNNNSGSSTESAEDTEMADEQINTTALFSTEDIVLATKQSNFNKGLGPDCFDGNLMDRNQELGMKVMNEIAEALNSSRIPEYLRVGRLVPL